MDERDHAIRDYQSDMHFAKANRDDVRFQKQTETNTGACIPGSWYDICFPRLGRCELLAMPAKVAVVLALGAVLVVARGARRLDARIQVEIGGKLQEEI